MVLVNRQKDSQQRTEATGHITHHRRAPQVECDVHGPRARSIEQYGKYYWVPDGWNQPDRVVHPTRLVPQGVKTNTKNCLQALFVFDWVQEYYQRVSGRRESGRRHSSWIIKRVLQNHGEGLNCFFFYRLRSDYYSNCTGSQWTSLLIWINAIRRMTCSLHGEDRDWTLVHYLRAAQYGNL